jgi:16S rRNA (uracil1498-N3)-methyltransferase
MDFTIQKAVELGVKSIRPIFTERSQRPWKSDRLEKKLAHWSGIIVHACEQSGRTQLPELYSPISYQDYLTSRNPGRPSLILDPGASQSLKELNNESSEFDLLIGPEGGFSSQEILSADNADILAVKIGPRILRTESAAIVAITCLQSMFGDLG